MKKQIKKVIFLAMAGFFLSACGETKNSQEEDLDQLLDKDAKTMEVADEVVSDIIMSIPPPIELAYLVQSSGADYSDDILNDLDKIDSYTSGFERGLALGAMGADLGYVNLYEKTGVSLEYLNGIRKVADDLNIGQFFDFETIKRLADNSNSIDSIVGISTEGFEKMNNYLKEKKRGNISMAILIGGWIESLHIAAQVNKQSKNPNEELVERIGEQKIVFGDINVLLEIYHNDAPLNKVAKDMQNLKALFDKVSITYEYSDPVTREVDGMLIVEQNTKSIVKIDEETLQGITKEVEELRNKLY